MELKSEKGQTKFRGGLPMLCQLRFKNFASYRGETIFDMQATDIEEFRDSLIPPPGDKFSELLPVSVVFGPKGVENPMRSMRWRA